MPALFAGEGGITAPDAVYKIVKDEPWYVTVPVMLATFAAMGAVVLWWNREPR